MCYINTSPCPRKCSDTQKQEKTTDINEPLQWFFCCTLGWRTESKTNQAKPAYVYGQGPIVQVVTKSQKSLIAFLNFKTLLPVCILKFIFYSCRHIHSQLELPSITFYFRPPKNTCRVKEDNFSVNNLNCTAKGNLQHLQTVINKIHWIKRSAFCWVSQLNLLRVPFIQYIHHQPEIDDPDYKAGWSDCLALTWPTLNLRRTLSRWRLSSSISATSSSSLTSPVWESSTIPLKLSSRLPIFFAFSRIFPLRS